MFYAYGMSITLRYASSRNDAASILNDAFMQVFTNIKEYDTSRSFKPWFRRILINTAINHYRRNKNRQQWESLDNIENDTGINETVLSGISYQEIIEMIQELSPAYRAVFNLYVIEGFKHKEIAKMLEITVGTSKSNLSKAKKNLQALLEKSLI